MMARRKRRVTSAEFFKVLKKIRATWGTWEIIDGLMRHGHIRCSINDLTYDPLTRVYKEKFGDWISINNGWDMAANDLGLDLRFARRLVNAADNTGNYRLRQKLLRATGLA